MFSENQLEELIKKYAPEIKPEDIQDMFDEGEVSLGGKYVRIMGAPTSTTLTNEQVEQIQEGVFINGNFLGYKNPILLPFGTQSYNVNYGIIIGVDTSTGRITEFATYYIDSDKKITKGNVFLSMNGYNSKMNIQGKQIPAYPSDTGTFTLKMVNGTLTWVADE